MNQRQRIMQAFFSANAKVDGPDFGDGPQSDGFAPGFEERCGTPTFLQDIEQRVAAGEISHEEALTMVDQQALIDGATPSGGDVSDT